MYSEFKVRARFNEPLLGSIAKNPEVYKAWIESKKKAVGDELPPEEEEQKSWTGFYTDDKGLHLMDYQIKGFLKEAAVARPKVLGLRNSKTGDLLAAATIRGRLERWVFVRPRRIYLGKTEPDGFIERPIRCKTARGDRIALARSDMVENAEIEFSILIVDDTPITQEMVGELLRYGELMGLGQWRGGGYGSFTYEVLS